MPSSRHATSVDSTLAFPFSSERLTQHFAVQRTCAMDAMEVHSLGARFLGIDLRGTANRTPHNLFCEGTNHGMIRRVHFEKKR